MNVGELAARDGEGVDWGSWLPAFWPTTQLLQNAATSDTDLLYTNLAASILLVALIPGCPRSGKAAITLGLHVTGTMDLSLQVDISHHKLVPSLNT